MKKTLLLNYLKAATSRNPRKNTTRINGLLALLVTLMVYGNTMGQLNISAGGSAISQDFNSLGSSSTALLPTDWTVQKSNTERTIPNYLSTATNVERSGGNSISSTASNGIYRFNANNDTSESAIGGLSSTSSTKSMVLYGRFKNNSAVPITTLSLSYSIEKYRNGTNSSGYTIQLFYSTNGTSWTSCGSNFTTNFSVDTNSDGFTTSPGTSVQISNIKFTPSSSVSQNGVFYLAWLYSVTSGSTTSSAPALGIDDISISASTSTTYTTSWSNGTPTSTIDAIINGNYTEAVNISCKDLTINSGNTLTIGAANSLTVAGNLVNNGNLIFKSDSNGTARFASYSGAAITSTNVTVERYIPAKRAWRALTAPVSTTGSIFANWQEGGTGNGVNGFDIWMPAGSNGLTAGGSSNSLLEYNSADNTWTGITATNGSSSMMNSTKNKPFMAFVTGPYGAGNITSNSAATTLRATGSLIIGQQTYTTVANKYTFIGNPYASPLSLSSMITSNNASFEGNIWIWDANTSVANPVGIYNLYNNGTYTNVTNTPVASTTEIQSGQAFFVRSTAGDSFIIQESNKGTTNSAANIVFRDAAPAQLLRVGLYKQENNEWSGRDGAMTVILQDANANQSPNKMANGTENVAFVKNGSLFASEHHLPLVASDVLNVRVWRTTAGANYKLKINTEQFASTNLNATLEDLFTNSRTPLNLEGTAVEYPFTVTTDALSTGDRFRIVFQNAVLGTNNPTATSFSIVPNPVIGDSFQVNLGTLATGKYSYSICNAIGQEVEKGILNNVTQNTNYEVKMNNSATGIYIMKIKGNDNTVFTAKIIKK